MPNVFSVDVERWCHLLDNEQAPSAARWTRMESRVRWMADEHPELIADIPASGHEMASHGFSHTLIYEQKPDGSRGDLRRATDAITRAAGVRLGAKGKAAVEERFRRSAPAAKMLAAIQDVVAGRGGAESPNGRLVG